MDILELLIDMLLAILSAAATCVAFHEKIHERRPFLFLMLVVCTMFWFLVFAGDLAKTRRLGDSKYIYKTMPDESIECIELRKDGVGQFIGRKKSTK